MYVSGRRPTDPDEDPGEAFTDGSLPGDDEEQAVLLPAGVRQVVEPSPIRDVCLFEGSAASPHPAVRHTGVGSIGGAPARLSFWGMSVEWAQTARGLMLPGESLRAALVVQVAPGNLPRPPRPDPAVWTRYKFFIAYGVVTGSVKPLDYLPDRVSDRLYGVAAAGDFRSRAAELVKAHLGIVAPPDRVTVVTDRRLLLCAAGGPGELDMRWAVPRTDIARTRRERHRLRARFRVEFIDGSWIAYGTPRLGSNQPIREIAAAFSTTV